MCEMMRPAARQENFDRQTRKTRSQGKVQNLAEFKKQARNFSRGFAKKLLLSSQ
jgi:hypothetical protein